MLGSRARKELKMEISSSECLFLVKSDEDIFIGTNTFDCMFLILLWALVEQRKNG